MAKKKKPARTAAEEPDFEEALARLEAIVRLLEEGDIGLSEALTRYEEGVKLLRQSYDLLQRAERRIELLSGVDAEGKAICEPFDDRATLPSEETSQPESSQKRGADKGGGTPLGGVTDVDAPGRLF